MSVGMGELTTGKMDEILRDENTTTFLTKIPSDFYQEVRQTLSSMMDRRNALSGEERNLYADKVKRTIIVANRIIDRRTRKVFDSAMREVYDNTMPDLVQATVEERMLYRTIHKTIRTFRDRVVE